MATKSTSFDFVADSFDFVSNTFDFVSNTFDFVAYLSPTPSTLSAIPSTLSPICRRFLRLCYWFVAVDIVAKVEHVQIGRLCRKQVIFVTQMWNVFSTLSPVCTEPKRQSRLCRIQIVASVYRALDVQPRWQTQYREDSIETKHCNIYFTDETTRRHEPNSWHCDSWPKSQH